MPEQNVPVAPAAPAPAVVPAPVVVEQPTPQVPAPKPSLADAQITGPITLPSVAPAVPAPAAPTAPVPPVSPDAAAEQKRVADAQRKMHEATAEAARLRNQLNTILNHPVIGPVVQNVTNPQQPVTPQEDEIKQAFKAWQQAPDDESAFRHLLATAETRATKRAVAEMQSREQERVNRGRAQQRDMAVASAINKHVTEHAPDVPIELFWAMSTKAELETPTDLVTVTDKLDWQIQRAVTLARDIITSRVQPAVQGQQQSQQIRHAAGVVMSPGQAPVAGGTPQTSTPMTFVDQLKASQARKVPAAT